MSSQQQRTVPEPQRDALPVTGLEDLRAHLAALEADPSTPFDVKLLDDVELQLNESNIPPLLPVLLPPLAAILKSATQDPTPLLSLTVKLLSPLPFPRLLTIADPPSVLAALQSPLPGANLLGLAVVHKAAASPADAALLSTLDDVFLSMLTVWLVTPDTGVAEKAGKVLGDLLTTDCPKLAPPPPEPQTNGTGPSAAAAAAASMSTAARPRNPGTGNLWSLFLDMSSLIRDVCSDAARPVRERTLSQGRVLRLLPRLATLDIAALTRAAAAASATGQPVFPEGGLLPWAALEMVDRDDMLMRLNLVDFFEELVSVMRVAGSRSAETDADLRTVVRAASRAGDGDDVREALTSLPDRTVEEEAEPLREFVRYLLS